MPGWATNCATMADITDDAFLGGRLRLRQPRQGHRAGHDAMLLAASTGAKAGDRVVEFGAGAGAAGLALATRVPGLDLVLVEIDGSLADLARSNAASNGITACVMALDVAAGAPAFALAGLSPDSADVVLMNPPFNDSGQYGASPDRGRAVAHVATATTLADWVHAARRILKSGGALTLIWRTDGLTEVLTTLERGYGGLVVQPVHARAELPAIRMMVRAIKGSRAPLRLLPGLMIDSEAVKMALTDALALPLAGA
jgi:tRNA1(Val) A37 N6-methylase TrmN6